MAASAFLAQADAAFARIAAWLEKFDPDELDYSVGDGMVSIEFADGSRFVVSRQSAANQLWLAAAAHGWHYSWNESRQAWLDDKDGHELFAGLARVIGEQLGRQVFFDG
ncbi:MAG: iron donor protein CyaY [Deltaproteobacteria bacterium]|jgi:CyaY protein|nr:iron donor protein CyaY [Deltaproteobacteria bacterium]